jgi:hypothetical protein
MRTERTGAPSSSAQIEKICLCDGKNNFFRKSLGAEFHIFANAG